MCYNTTITLLVSNITYYYHVQINVGMSRPKCYHTMDAFVKLVVVLVRYSGEPSNTLAKVNLLNKVSTTSIQ